SKTANFPGSTVEAHVGNASIAPRGGSGPESVHIVDLPGLYSLNLDRPESKVARDYLEGRIHLDRRPEALLIIADATNLGRNLVFAAEALRLGLPAVLALNMSDLAQKRGLTIDARQMSEYIGVPVVPICARSGEGVDRLLQAMREPMVSAAALPDSAACANAGEYASACARWADGVVTQSVGGDHAVGTAHDTFTDRLDAAFTHPILGLLVFLAVMAGLFWTIFALATVPMDLIERVFAVLGTWTHAAFGWADARFGWDLTGGSLHNLLIDGVISGVAGTVVFLPQICLLFFLISLLEDTGYLARASFVMDRLLRRFGLPGHAFVPMLSAHACAIPAIMSSRLIPDQRDRFATILITPFLSCSARLPVYVLLISMLFAGRPVLAGLAFAGCYALGAVVALLTALLFRRTILKGPSRPMVLELPSYKMPSLRNALAMTIDRAMTFLRKAGTVIMAICIVLWWLSAYPQTGETPQAASMRAAAAEVQASNPDRAAAMAGEADAIDSRAQLANSFAGRIGRTIEPVFRPVGYDWQLTIGVLTSFAAREVFVSTMSVLFAGVDDAEDPQVLDRITHAQRSDGTPVFTTATAASLLVFYVLAMQCLATLVVTRRETGSWKWALLQLGYMTAVAYAFAFVTYSGIRLAGVS
ncbi:MAG TPA: ferrous iron transporter B, partial [Phycisphaerales bacterium]|nr:ferrous iron transporter B [Phycisphaerales bacterium]